MNAPMIQVGGAASKETVAEVRAAINDILSASNAENKTKRAALRALTELAQAQPVGSMSVSNSNFDASSTVFEGTGLERVEPEDEIPGD